MFCDVYPLRSRGQKLAEDEVRKGVRRGWLELANRDDGAPVRVAVLRSDRGTVAGELNCASVSRIAKGGLLVTGWGSDRHRQAWWCVPVPSDPPRGP